MTLRQKALAASLFLTLPLAAQTTIPDPANLMGERVSPQSPADDLPINHGAPALQQLLLKLRTRASLMLIVAHPDDEDGGMLTFESRGQGARVAMLTLTRGEGGQNLMTADFNDALGLIRTQELLAADRYLGTDQFFGTEVDFGFSKTKEEAFQQWTHQRVLYDAVRAVRLYRPLVLASVFVGGVTDGHGHHQVSGEICQEVFLAAADPKVFPEMGLPPWAPLKVYARVPFARVTPQGMFDYATGKYAPPLFHNYVTGQDITHEPTATVLIHEGDPATVTFPGHPATPTLGMDGLTYVQFARKGLALQKTQIGPNVRLAPPGRSDTGYTLMASRLNCAPSGCPILEAVSSRQTGVPAGPHLSGGVERGVSGASPTALPSEEPSLFTGIDTSLAGLVSLAITSPIKLRPALESIDRHLAEAQSVFDPAHPERTAPSLHQSLREVDGLISLINESQFGQQYAKFNLLHELHIKRVQLNNALLLALGVTLSARLSQPDADLLSTQHTLAVEVHVAPGPATIKSAHILSQGEPIASAPSPAHAGTLNLTSTLAQPLPPTRPYFSADPDSPVYTLSNPNLRNAPATPPPLVADAHFDFQGVPLEFQAVVESPQSHRAAVVVPPLSVALMPSSGIITPSGRSLSLAALVESHTSSPSATAAIQAPAGWEVNPPQVRLPAPKPGGHSLNSFTVAPKNYFSGQLYQLTAVASDSSQNYRESFRPVGYPSLTPTNYYTPATYRATAVDVTTAPNLRIAYLPGTGDDVPAFLPNLGITPTILTLADLTPSTLAKFDAVLLGVRAYSAHPELAGSGSKPLLDFAAAGGVVIVQYNSGGSSGSAAPYPFNLPGDSAHNVVVETQPVTLLAPSDPLLTWPNRLTSSDFTGWTEEWGHGFASTWDPHYTPLLEVHDPGQDPQQGGLLLARTGKGAYIYCALALYRQLPEGVPGAYRLLANLLSYAKNPAR